MDWQGTLSGSSPTQHIFEFYSPELARPGTLDGTEAKADFVGWTGCGPIQLLLENVMGLRPDAAANTLTWRLRRSDRHGVERLRLGSNTVSVVCRRRDGPESPAVLEVESEEELVLEVVHPLGDEVFEIAPGKHTLVAPGKPNS